MMITVLENEKIFKLDTPSCSYVMAVRGQGRLLNLYYGAPVDDAQLCHLAEVGGKASFWAIPADEPDDFSTDVVPMEYSGSGSADLRPAAITTVDEDGDNVTDLRYHSYEIISGKPGNPGLPATYLNEGDEAQTLKITLRDEVKDVYVDLYYTVFAFSPAIARWSVVRNEGKQVIDVKRVMSGSLQFPHKDFDLMHMHGAWAREFNVERTPIAHTTQSVQSFRGSSSHIHNPFAAILAKDATEDAGEVFGISLIYSSNFIIETDVDAFDTLRVNFGINDRAFGWKLQPGEAFSTPEAVLVYSECGLGDMSRAYQKLYRKNLARGKYRDQARPVLLNSWEGVYLDFNAEKILRMARAAAKLGIELFVLDDGWFGKRNSDDCALGDWFVNEEKLGCTMNELVEEIKKTGMDFGLWFEPEMISPDSDLFRVHPDWCLHQKKRQPSLGRHQLILDMTRKDVQDYVVETVSGVLKSADIRYVKWDMNRNMAEVGSAQLPADRLGEIYHRYILGVYSIMERITTAFPDVLFESCSGGGGRFDAGILHYMPQNWTSDDSDAIQRLKIQYGCSMVYPASAMTCHVSAVPNHQVWRVTPLHTRGNVAMAGSFGYELDMSKMTEEENIEVIEQIKEYKKYRDLVITGDQYRLISPVGSNECAFMVVSEDKATAIVTYVKVLNDPNPPITRLRLKGLEEGAKYRDVQSGAVYTAKSLMNAGLNMPATKVDFDSVRIVLEKV